MPDIIIREEGVSKLLKNLNPHKAAGPDDISPWVLQTTADEISPALSTLFQLSIDTGVVPDDWLCANITPIFKKGDRTKPANYRSVNLTAVCSKVIEHILHSNIMTHLDTHSILCRPTCSQQHGFCTGHSSETQLLSTIQDIAQAVDKKQQVDVIIMDFQKAFDKVPHQQGLNGLNRPDFNRPVKTWF